MRMRNDETLMLAEAQAHVAGAVHVRRSMNVSQDTTFRKIEPHVVYNRDEGHEVVADVFAYDAFAYLIEDRRALGIARAFKPCAA
jgi:hypothetical protein